MWPASSSSLFVTSPVCATSGLLSAEPEIPNGVVGASGALQVAKANLNASRLLPLKRAENMSAVSDADSNSAAKKRGAEESDAGADDEQEMKRSKFGAVDASPSAAELGSSPQGTMMAAPAIELRLMVAPKDAGAIIGRGGANVSAIQANTGVRCGIRKPAFVCERFPLRSPHSM